MSDQQEREMSWQDEFSEAIFDEAIGSLDVDQVKAYVSAQKPRQLKRIFNFASKILYRERLFRAVAGKTGVDPRTVQPVVGPVELGFAFMAWAVGRERGLTMDPRVARWVERQMITISLEICAEESGKLVPFRKAIRKSAAH